MCKVLTVSVLICLVTLATTSAPNKCCPEGTALLKRKTACWNPKVNKTTPVEGLKINCTLKIRFYDFSIDSDGKLLLSFYNNKTAKLGSDKYCVGNVTTLADREFKNVTDMAVVCSEEKDVTNDKMSGYFMLVSVIFLLLTAAIYVALPQMRDLQGKSIISFCVTFAIGLCIMGLMKLTTYSNMTLCAIRGFMMYYFILSAVFWTNAIAIQILLSIRRPTITSFEWKEFSWYAAYAWGTPAIFTVIMAIVNFAPGNHARPGIGLMTCWFYDLEHQWYYMYSVWSILLVANIGIFIYTFVQLWRNTFAANHLKALKYKFLMTLRLFIVLGVGWIFEIISSLVEYSVVWLVLDIFNILQGVFIFLVLVVFRRRTLKAMYKRGWLDCISGPLERHLAKADDDEQDVVEHTRDVPLQDS